MNEPPIINITSLDNAVAIIAAQRTTIQNQGCAVSELTSERDSWRRTSEKLQAQLTAMTKERNEARGYADKYDLEITKLNEQLAAAQSVIAKQQVSVEDLSKEHTKQAERATVAINSHAVTQEGYTALRANYDTLSRQYWELEQSLDSRVGNWKAAEVQYRDDIQHLQTALAESQQRVKELEQRCNEAACDCVAFADELLKTKAKLTACEEERDAALRMLKDANVAYRQAVDMLDRKHSVAACSHGDLQARVAALTEALKAINEAYCTKSHRFDDDNNFLAWYSAHIELIEQALAPKEVSGGIGGTG